MQAFRLQMVFSSLILLLLSSLTLSSMPGPDWNVCLNVTGEQVRLPPIKLPANFKVSAVYTDWVKKTAAKIFEAHIDSRQAISVIKRDYPSLKWMDVGHRKVLFKGLSCHIQRRGDDQPINIPRHFDSLTLKDTSILDFLRALLRKNLTGVNRGTTRVHSGVEGVRWVFCQSPNSTASVAGTAIEVVYAGKDSIPPPSSAFYNPTILAVTLTSYVNITDPNSSIDAKVSLQMEPFDDADDSDPLFSIPMGVLCPDLPPVPSLPLRFPNCFAARVNFQSRIKPTNLSSNTFNFTNNIVADTVGQENSKTFLEWSLLKDVNEGITDTGRGLTTIYDSINNITADTVVEGHARTFREYRMPKDAIQVIHDIERGLEYVKSPSGCRVSELSERTMDIDDNGMLAQPLDFLLPEALDMDFAFYRNVTIAGSPCSVYRAAHSGFAAEFVMESIVDREDGRLVEFYSYFRQNPTMFTTYELSILPADTVSLISSLHDCYNVSRNSTYTVIIPRRSVSDVSVLSATTVANVIGSSFSALLPRFSPHRFRFFFYDEKDALRVMFSIADPAMVSGIMENTTKEFIKVFNQTLSANTFTVTIAGPNGKTQDWTIAKSSLKLLPSDDEFPFFPIYSFGSLLFTGFSMLIFGFLVGVIFLCWRFEFFSFSDLLSLMLGGARW